MSKNPWFHKEPDPIKTARDNCVLDLMGTPCPIPGCQRKATHPHHTLIRRKPDHAVLYSRYNITMVCGYHHIPEAEDLGFHAMRYKMMFQHMHPDDIEAWIDGCRRFFKEPVTLPGFYYIARDNIFGY